MRPSGYTRKSTRNAQMSPTPTAGPRTPFEPLGIVGNGEGHRGREAERHRPAYWQGLVVPRVADVGLEHEPGGVLHVVAEGVAQIGHEAHPPLHPVAV